MHHNGCNINETNFHGDTAILIASRLRHLGILKYLHENGCELNKFSRPPDSDDVKAYNCLLLASYNRRPDVVEYLHQNGCNIPSIFEKKK